MRFKGGKETGFFDSSKGFIPDMVVFERGHEELRFSNMEVHVQAGALHNNVLQTISHARLQTTEHSKHLGSPAETGGMSPKIPKKY